MSQAADLAAALARQAEAVCRHYLPNGRREGRYWLVGDTDNSPGRSLFVRLTGPTSGKGAAGKWTDAATAQRGDLLDLIATNQRLTSLAETLDEARRFLAMPRIEHERTTPREPAPRGSPEAARRLWAISHPIVGTLAETYLRHRGIDDLRQTGSLRFHPRCWYRPNGDDAPDTRQAWPALIASIRYNDGALTGVHRTWLDPSGTDKAPIATPRRAMGHLLGNGVRMGVCTDTLAAGEGIETMLSLRQALPKLPMIAALSANHLAALTLPPTLRRLYIAVDADAAGRGAAQTLATKAETAGIEVLPLNPLHADFNDDLRRMGLPDLIAHLRPQLAPCDVRQFLISDRHAA